MTNDQSAFWRSPHRWPVKMPGYVFLAEAMNRLGKARYPVSWVGDEPWIDVPPPLPATQGEASHDQVRRARGLLGLEPSEIAVPILRPGGKPTNMPAPLADEEWASARLRSLEISVPAAEKSARWQDVRELTCNLFRVGGLHCHLRAIEGGEYQGPLKPEVWNTENTTARFGRCQIDLGNLYGQTAYQAHENIRLISYSRQNFNYIFVDERSLSESVAAIGKLSPPPKWIADKPEKPKKPGNKSIDDSESVAEMLLLMESGQASSAWQAARMVAPKAKGAGAVDSKQSRVFRAFSAEHPAHVASRVRDQ